MTPDQKLIALKAGLDAALSSSVFMEDGELLPIYGDAARILSRLIEKMPRKYEGEYLDGAYYERDCIAECEGHNALRQTIIDIITREG